MYYYFVTTTPWGKDAAKSSFIFINIIIIIVWK